MKMGINIVFIILCCFFFHASHAQTYPACIGSTTCAAASPDNRVDIGGETYCCISPAGRCSVQMSGGQTSVTCSASQTCSSGSSSAGSSASCNYNSVGRFSLPQGNTAKFYCTVTGTSVQSQGLTVYGSNFDNFTVTVTLVPPSSLFSAVQNKVLSTGFVAGGGNINSPAGQVILPSALQYQGYSLLWDIGCQSTTSSSGCNMDSLFAVSGASNYGTTGGSYSSCSKSCGGGTRSFSPPTGSPACSLYTFSRTALFRYLSTDQSASQCPSYIYPSSTIPCNTQPCPLSSSTGSNTASTYSWQSGPWSDCTSTCGSGVMTRDVRCISSAGQTVSNDYCTSTSSSKPATYVLCNTVSCSILSSSWVGTWQVSTACESTTCCCLTGFFHISAVDTSAKLYSNDMTSKGSCGSSSTMFWQEPTPSKDELIISSNNQKFTITKSMTKLSISNGQCTNTAIRISPSYVRTQQQPGDSTNSDSSSSLSVGVLVGIIVGSVAAVAIIIFAVFLYVHYAKKKQAAVQAKAVIALNTTTMASLPRSTISTESRV